MFEKLTFADLERNERSANADHLTQEQLEEESQLIRWYHSVHNKPIEDFNVEDLARALRQQMHIEHIVPFALSALRKDPLAGEIYEGELIASFRSVPGEFWLKHPNLKNDLKQLINQPVVQFEDDLADDIMELSRRLEQ